MSKRANVTKTINANIGTKFAGSEFKKKYCVISKYCFGQSQIIAKLIYSLRVHNTRCVNKARIFKRALAANINYNHHQVMNVDHKA